MRATKQSQRTGPVTLLAKSSSGDSRWCDFRFRRRGDFTRTAAVERPFCVVAQADSCRRPRKRISMSASAAPACVGAPVSVAPASNWSAPITRKFRIEFGARATSLRRNGRYRVRGPRASPRHPHDRIVLRLAMPSVSIASRLAVRKKPPPWIGGSCAGSPSTAADIRTGHQVAAEFGVHHRNIRRSTLRFAFDREHRSQSSKLGCSSPDSRAR